MFILVPVTAIFLALNATILPFAYLRTLFNKINMCRTKNCSVCETLSWIVLGMPILIAYQLLDLVDFLRWSTSMDYLTKGKSATRAI